MLMHSIRNIYCCQKIFQMQEKKIFNPFSMNILHYNQYHQYQTKLDPLRKWCVKAALSHSYTFCSEMLLSKECFLSISLSLSSLTFWHLALQDQLFFQNGASFCSSKLGSLHFLLFWLLLISSNFIPQHPEQQLANSLPLAMQTDSNDSKSAFCMTQDHCSCIPWQAPRTQIRNEGTNSSCLFLNI